MEGPFISPPAKRSFYTVAGVLESNTYSGSGESKRGRSKPPPPPIVLSPGQVSFRLLCHLSKIGGVIGKSGSIIKQFQQDTGAKIRIEEAVPACEDRIVLIVGSETIKKKITLTGSDEVEKESKVEREVSPAQEALIRVFERVLDVEAETEGIFPPMGGVVSCRLLAVSNQVGSVIGKGGKIIEKIRKESGARIKVLAAEQLPACASANDELIQIDGDILAVKKALVAVSRRLQDCPPEDKAHLAVSKPVETVSHGSFPGPRSELLLHGSSLLPPLQGSSIDYATRSHPLSTEVDRISTLEPKKKQQEVTFRILCSNEKVGGVIGKGGAIVRALQNETGASISVGASVAESEERVITVSAPENLESQYSPAQNAVIRVFTRSVEAGIEKGLEPGSSNGSPVSARLLIQANQVGCLMGKGGTIVSEMRKLTGAGIRILGSEQIPKCASENDQLVQINGEFGNVQDALFRITCRLRDNLVPNKILNGITVGSYPTTSFKDISPYARVREHNSAALHLPMGLSHGINRQTTLAQSMDHLGLSHSLDHPHSPRLWASQQIVHGGNPKGTADIGRRLTNLRGSLELGSGSKSAIVTNTTVEIVVPARVIGSVYGENGTSLTRLRQISGAKIIVHDPHPGKSEAMIIISGTPDQTQAAQSLLQAFILSGRSSPDHSRLL